MTRSISVYRVSLMAWLPALLLAGMYYLWLGYRRDYLGHYAAGYGGTLAVLSAILSRVPTGPDARLATWVALPGTCLCIGLGAIAEATVFRLARFDEIDLCNQSLGAVMAGIVIWYLARHPRPTDSAYVSCVLAGLATLLLGTYFALT